MSPPGQQVHSLYIPDEDHAITGNEKIIGVYADMHRLRAAAQRAERERPGITASWQDHLLPPGETVTQGDRLYAWAAIWPDAPLIVMVSIDLAVMDAWLPLADREAGYGPASLTLVEYVVGGGSGEVLRPRAE